MTADTADIAATLRAKKDEIEQQLGVLETKPGDQGSISFGKRVGEGTSMAVDRLSQVAVHDKLQVTLADVRRATAKLEDGSYGRCDVCDEPIGDERLEALRGQCAAYGTPAALRPGGHADEPAHRPARRRLTGPRGRWDGHPAPGPGARGRRRRRALERRASRHRAPVPRGLRSRRCGHPHHQHVRRHAATTADARARGPGPRAQPGRGIPREEGRRRARPPGGR